MARRTAEDAAQTRVAITAAARQLFATEGYAETSTSMIVAAAGVTRGALYHHFIDKTDVFRTVFTELVNELNTSVLEAGLAHSDARDAFRAGAMASIRFSEREDYRRIALVDAPAVLGLELWHELDIAVGLSSMRMGLMLLHRQGHLDAPASPATAVLLFGALTQAGMTVARHDPDGPTAEELVDSFMTIALSGSRRPAAPIRRR